MAQDRINAAANGTQTRLHNLANELYDVSWLTPPTSPPNGAWIDPKFDAAGNMTEGPYPNDLTQKQLYVYDAWNRLVKVRNGSSQLLAEYEYDGLGRRIVQKAYSRQTPGVLEATYDYYYNEQWQVLQVRKNGLTSPHQEFVWHPYYIDAPALLYAAGVVDPYYYTHDANYNVTALMNYTAGVTERYEYTPYGQVTFLAGDWTVLPQQKSTVGNPYLFTGRQLDSETGLYQYRHRYYDPQLGRFVSRDPIGYYSGPNLYAYVGGRPSNSVDPSGLANFWNVYSWGIDNPHGTWVSFFNPLESGNVASTSAFSQQLLVNQILGFLPTSEPDTVRYVPDRWEPTGYRMVVDLGGGPRSDALLIQGVNILGVGSAFLPKPRPFGRVPWDCKGAPNSAGLSRGEFLRERYAQYTTVQRQARIAELAQGNHVLREAGVPPQYISEALQSFEPGTITSRVAGDVDFGLRFYGGVSGPKSPYLSPTFPLGNLRELNAIPPGNTLENVIQYRIRPGTPILEGRVRPAFGQPGGGRQIYVPDFFNNLLPAN